MTQEEKNLIENNNLFAQFLGWELNSIGCYGYFRQFEKFLHNPITGNDRSFNPEQLAFHESYDWLMMVWIKFRSLNWYHQEYCSAYSQRHRYFVFIISSKLTNGSKTEVFNELV